MQCTQDFALLTQNEKIRDKFEADFSKWSHSIIRYCKDTQQRMAAIWVEIEAYSDNLSEGEPRLTCVCKHAMHVSNVGHLGHFFNMQTLFV